jgi:hypothetical protein
LLMKILHGFQWILYLHLQLLLMEKKPIPNVVGLVLLFLSTLAIIYLGYVQGHMSISTVYKNLQ